MDRAKFFASARSALFGGRLTQGQVDGINAILDVTQVTVSDLRMVAYMLATAYHETAKTMQPITEYGGRRYFDKYDTGRLAIQLGNTPDADGDGYLYRGRGYVQLTGRRNYQVIGDLLDIDLINHPDLALQADIAGKIMVQGMISGHFTGKKLADYFNGNKADWLNARRIINGMDRAKDVAAYGRKFYTLLLEAMA
jgi:putative chitinase